MKPSARALDYRLCKNENDLFPKFMISFNNEIVSSRYLTLNGIETARFRRHFFSVICNFKKIYIWELQQIHRKEAVSKCHPDSTFINAWYFNLHSLRNIFEDMATFVPMYHYHITGAAETWLVTSNRDCIPHCSYSIFDCERENKVAEGAISYIHILLHPTSVKTVAMYRPPG